MPINIVFRAHVKNDQRLELTKQTIESAIDAGLLDIAIFTIVDDHSKDEYAKLIQDFCESKNINYVKAEGVAHTRNGLVESLKVAPDEPILCCVDDIVFSKKIKKVIKDIFENHIPTLEKKSVNWGLIGMFCNYSRDKKSKTHGLPLWSMDNKCVYALVAHVYNPKLSKTLINDWDQILKGEKELTAHQDDLWTAIHMEENKMVYFNTNWDYVQHVGEYQRSFGTDNGGDNSCYKTNHFLE